MKLRKHIILFFTVIFCLSVISPSLTTVKVLADENEIAISNYTMEEQNQINEIAKVLEEMFSSGVTQENLKQYVQSNFSEEELIIADSEMGTNLSKAASMEKFDWGSLGNCMANKIKDEFFAMINVGMIVKYAQKKAWNELAAVVLKFVKANGLKTNVYIIAGQLAIWAVQCGLS